MLSRIIVARGKASREKTEKILLNFEFLPGVKETIQKLQDMGYTLAIISGSFNIVVDAVATQLNIQHAYSNTYTVYDENDMLKKIVLTFADNEYKVELVHSVCRRFGLHPKDVLYVADGDNDSDIFIETTGVAIVNEIDVHEPWKQEAVNQGEEFARNIAHKYSTYQINKLSDLINIVKKIEVDNSPK